MNNNSENYFPRSLTDDEKKYLFSVLPENKPGYKSYREKINELSVIGYGRFGGTNLILGKENEKPDLSIPSSPVFAAGYVIYDSVEVYIVIHEEEFDQIEIDISETILSDEIKEKKEINRWNYSEWKPGDRAPNDNGMVRQVDLSVDNYILAFAPTHKKIWVHNSATGINHFIPSGIFYNELMSIKGIRESKIVLNYNLLFEKLSEFGDNELFSAFINYNKLKRRIKFDYNQVEIKKEKESFFQKVFRRKKKSDERRNN